MSDHRVKKQACQTSKAKTGFLMMTLMLAFISLTGCGKRPGYVDPPPEVEEDHFPRVYPDPATDPKP